MKKESKTKKKLLLNNDHMHLGVVELLNRILEEGTNLDKQVRESIKAARDLATRVHVSSLEKSLVS